MQNNGFSSNKTLTVRGQVIDLSLPRVMGILNITPDSFYADSRKVHEADVVQQARQMVEAGATFLDVGAYSSRPGADDISVDEEWTRLGPAIRAIRQHLPHCLMSVDTFRASIAQRAVEAGADMINDISGGEADSHMFETVARLRVPYVAMHMRGTPQTMTQLTDYTEVVREVIDYFHPKVETLRGLGVADIIIDPGFGFAKTPAHGFELLRELRALEILQQPILVGVSRKSMIWKTLGLTAREALNGTSVLHTIALLHGASILRVHDVREAIECVQLVQKLHGK